MKLLSLLTSGFVSALAFGVSGSSAAASTSLDFSMADLESLASKIGLGVGVPIPLHSGPQENDGMVFSDADNQAAVGTNSLILQPVSRIEDLQSYNPNRLPLFHMLLAYANALDMLQVFPLDDARITVVTTKENPLKSNSYATLYQDQSAAAENQLGGYWSEPWKAKTDGDPSASFYYYCGSELEVPKLEQVSQAQDSLNWLEICETYTGVEATDSGGCGMERIQFAATYCNSGIEAPTGTERHAILAAYSNDLKEMLSAEYPGLYDQ